MEPIMTSERINRRMELMYLIDLYEFYEDNRNHLPLDNDFRKIIEAQEIKVAYLFNKIVNKEEK